MKCLFVKDFQLRQFRFMINLLCLQDHNLPGKLNIIFLEIIENSKHVDVGIFKNIFFWQASHILLSIRLIDLVTGFHVVQFRGNQLHNVNQLRTMCSTDLKLLTWLLPELYSTQSYYHYYYSWGLCLLKRGGQGLCLGEWFSWELNLEVKILLRSVTWHFHMHFR